MVTRVCECFIVVAVMGGVFWSAAAHRLRVYIGKSYDGGVGEVKKRSSVVVGDTHGSLVS